MTILIAIFYPLAVQYLRGGWWHLLFPVTAPIVILDIIANHTELALLTWDWPRPGEYTFSQRLARLQHDKDRKFWTEPLIAYLDYFDPTGKHVKE